MGLLRRILNWTSDDAAKERRLRLQSPLGWSSLFGNESAAGKVVTLESALQLPAVWSCIRISAQGASSLPRALYRRAADGGRDRVDDDLADVILENPNRDQTGQEFWEMAISWLLADGNAYIEKETFGRRLIELRVLPSNRTAPVRKDGELVYRYADEERREDIPRDRIMHLRGFGFGGDKGISPIRMGVQSIGAAIAADESAGKMFGNGLQAAGVVKSDQQLDAEQRKQIGEILREFAGSSRAGKTLVLEAGLEYQQISLNPEDAQMLETRRFNIEEIARWFGVPPILIGHAAQGQTMWGSGVEQILLAWLALGINPLCRRIEARIQKDLLRQRDRKLYAEFNREGLLQMDSKAKAEFLSSMVQNGLMSRNEGRAKLNLPKRSDADGLTAQTNLAPLEALGRTEGVTE